MKHKKGDKVAGQIKSITDFGVFVGLPGGIDGLVHLSDLSWAQPGETAVRDFKKGQEVEAVVLAIDVERERISLGIKQLEGDPFTNFVAMHDKGSVVNGTVKSLDAKGAVIALGGDVEGYLRASEISRDRIENRGFGSFGLNYRPPRTGRNPKSGEKVQVPQKHVPHFKAGKELRERVDFEGDDAK